MFGEKFCLFQSKRERERETLPGVTTAIFQRYMDKESGLLDFLEARKGV